MTDPKMFTHLFFVVSFTVVASEPFNRIEVPRSQEVNKSRTYRRMPREVNPVYYEETRRILRGHEVGDTRPYMVYLRPTSADPKIDPTWTCGGVIIHEQYILTSAACIEDVKHFYVVSGTHRWVPANDNSDACVKNGAKKAVWKCVPKSYVFDGMMFDNIQWMIRDIAVVKVEDDFNFERRVRGCDYIPQKVAYNNRSADYEKPGSIASISGWGSTLGFADSIAKDPKMRAAKNSPALQESDVVVLSKKNCKKRWPDRYHYIIEDHMICGKDGMDSDAMSKICSEQEVNCKDLVYSDEDEDTRRILKVPDPKDDLILYQPNFRRSKAVSGGFCENDHGGPLISGHGKTSMVIGIMSASMTKEPGNVCYGPFLYTSVYKNRHLIACAIDKSIGVTCRKLLRSSRTQMTETMFSWISHPDGPSKSELLDDATLLRTREGSNETSIDDTNTTSTRVYDKGLFVRK